MRKYLLATLAIVLALFVGALALAVSFGGPSAPSALASANNPFEAVDYSGLPDLSYYAASDGTDLAYRQYSAKGNPKGSAVLLHGSSADSRSMHPMAQAFVEAGFAVHALDVRGHGGSGVKGHVDYVGQLEDDLQAFMAQVQPVGPVTLVGFSSGGGFALRVAGGELAKLFDRYLLLAPFVSQEAPTYRSGSGGWVDVGVPRYVAILLLNQLGIERFNDLPVVSYALTEQARRTLTPEYSFNLAQNYRPEADYLGTIRGIQRPTRVVVGAQDEMFHAAQFSDVFDVAAQPVPVEVVEGANHVGLTLMPAALAAVVDAMNSSAIKLK
jgi:pimeloyl-ACP methyl ester carboxylesterase